MGERIWHVKVAEMTLKTTIAAVNLGDKKNGGFFKTDSIYLNLITFF